MKRLSFKLLDTEIRRATWFPLVMMAAIFLTAMGSLLHREHKNQVQQIERELFETISWQEGFIASETYLSNRRGIEVRFDNIINNWKAKYPSVQACLRLAMDEGQVTRCSNPDAEVDWASERVRERKIDFGSETVARLQYFVQRQAAITDILPPSILLSVLLAIVLAALVHHLLVNRLKKRVVSPLVEEIKQNERNTAIAEAVQMIAHDVKRPFRSLRSALQSLALARNKEVFYKFAVDIIPDIERGVKSVEAMLKDVMDIGTNVPIIKEDLLPIDLLNDAIMEMFRLHTHADIDFSYDLTHEHKILGDREKILRVVLNILENAANAIEGRGTIWFRTKEIVDADGQMTEFCIGNDGPPISADLQKDLFKIFFTTSRKGNGLGLAIAKKIVTSHGGRIWCESSDRAGTEFHFTLPTSSNPEHTKTVLPHNSIDVTLYAANGVGTSPSKIEAVKSSSSGSGHGSHVLVFDDDKLVRQCWEVGIDSQAIPSFKYFWSWEDFLRQRAATLVKGATAFVDINFKGSDFNGYDIARRLKRLGVKKLYAITGDMEAAEESGLFDQVLDKEVPRDIRGLVA